MLRYVHIIIVNSYYTNLLPMIVHNEELEIFVQIPRFTYRYIHLALQYNT